MLSHQYGFESLSGHKKMQVYIHDILTELSLHGILLHYLQFRLLSGPQHGPNTGLEKPQAVINVAYFFNSSANTATCLIHKL